MKLQAVTAAVVIAATSLGAHPAAAADVMLPPPAAAPDYQLGAPYPPPAPVTIVARDRSASPAGAYSICYVNGFQTQPGELDTWPDQALLRGSDGKPVHDPDWPDEVLLDTRTAQQRSLIAAVVSRWITGCAEKGYQAVEFDNLDTYTRSGGALRREDAVALAAELVAAAHSAGLAAAQKNAAEDAATFRAAGFDFAVTEECAAYLECDSFTSVYGAHVIDIEYTDNLPRSFAQMCDDPDTPASVVLRDRDLVAASAPGYHFELCR
ncbi:hypothetical protein BVC93_25685 [Mycobacterium sp. MS1601]|uniref:endo alpha-1,4 polygalactosaminidase n=1 Tax=Mycobacterium sp. MS1601 TaxID=1936029 RepID=UPI00097970AB|nr:endo alpha-1,4 polygalactosaminidase [Mycobacterium sp. MS1601]AQA05225.1 hypothetical protein BVC93_25685 [Mycobacterium sp. MS1601]